ncbi:MAG: nucleotidyltransferase family protein [Thermoprotei archaeon]
MKAAIIAGGLAKRLRPVTEEIPKSLVEVAGKPIIEWQLEWLKANNIYTIIILAGYRYEKLIEFLGSGRKFGVSVTYVIEDSPLGTGGAIKNAEPYLSNDVFVALNGDVLTDIPVSKLTKVLEDHVDAVASIALVPLKSPYGVVRVSEEGRIESFVEKPSIEDYLINAGVYVMKNEIFKYLPEVGDIEKTAFPQLAREGRLYGVKFLNNYWRSVDTIKDVEEVTNDIRAGRLKF